VTSVLLILFNKKEIYDKELFKIKFDEEILKNLETNKTKHKEG